MNTKILSLHQKGNLAVVQFSAMPNNALEIVTSAFALQSNLLEVREVSESGNVNELLVHNFSEKFVFLMDGDILDGAKQNRVLNASVLLAPQTKTKIPVSCVESGRWDYKSTNFKSSDHVAPVNLRANKSSNVTVNLEKNMGHNAEQGEVWGSVSEYSKAHGVHSKTSNLTDIYDDTSNSYSTWIDSFNYHPEANGVIFYKNNQPFVLDIFHRTEIMREYYPKLLKGVFFEMRQLKDSFQPMTDPEASYKTLDFMDIIEHIEKQEYRGVAEGIEHRYKTETISGFELSFLNHLIHKNAIAL